MYNNRSNTNIKYSPLLIKKVVVNFEFWISSKVVRQKHNRDCDMTQLIYLKEEENEK